MLHTNNNFFIISSFYEVNKIVSPAQDTLQDSLDLVADVLQLVEEALLGTLRHIAGAVALQTADLRLFLSGIVKLVLADVLPDLYEFLSGFLPFLNIIVAAVVAQLVGKVLQLADGALLRGSRHQLHPHHTAKYQVLDLHILPYL